MKIFDSSAHPELKALFPELTPVQFENSMLFALGLQQRSISLMRGVSYKNVTQSITEAKAKYPTASLTGLLTVFHVRLSVFALYGCHPPILHMKTK